MLRERRDVFGHRKNNHIDINVDHKTSLPRDKVHVVIATASLLFMYLGGLKRRPATQSTHGYEKGVGRGNNIYVLRDLSSFIIIHVLVLQSQVGRGKGTSEYQLA